MKMKTMTTETVVSVKYLNFRLKIIKLIDIY